MVPVADRMTPEREQQIRERFESTGAVRASDVRALLDEVDHLRGALREACDHVAEQDDRLPHRFSATPAEVDRFLRTTLAEDTHLDYQRAIGNAAAHEAADDIRQQQGRLKLRGELEADKPWPASDAADWIDPALEGGHFPAVLLCSRHEGVGGFGPCPGAPRCTPRTDEIGGA